MINITKESDIITPMSIKEVWKDSDTNRIEEQKMSPFIADHINDISDIIGVELEVVEKEAFIGDFRADIVCKDTSSDEVVVIENQLGKSDHEHLGKAYLYMSNLDAKTIVWICENARPEHIKAVEKFNEITSDEYSFYMLEMKFKRYDNNTAVYSFNNIVVPDQVNKLARDIKSTRSENSILVQEFLDKLEAELQKKTPKAKYDHVHRYMGIKLPSKAWFLVGVNKHSNIWFEVGYDNANVAGNEETWKAAWLSLKDNLSRLGWEFTYGVGTKNHNQHKLKLATSMDMEADMGDLVAKIMAIYEESVKTINEMK